MNGALATATWLLFGAGCVAFMLGVLSPTPEEALRGFLAAMGIWTIGGAASVTYDRRTDPDRRAR